MKRVLIILSGLILWHQAHIVLTDNPIIIPTIIPEKLFLIHLNIIFPLFPRLYFPIYLIPTVSQVVRETVLLIIPLKTNSLKINPEI